MMFGSLYLGALGMAALLGAVQWLVGDTKVDPPQTTIVRMVWIGFFAGVGGTGLLGVGLLSSAGAMFPVLVGTVLGTVCGMLTKARLSRRPSEPDPVEELPEEHTIEVETNTDSADRT